MIAAVAALSFAIWLYLLLGRGRFWVMREEPVPPPPTGAAPSVAAIVPARNEAAVVGRAIGSLAAQRYPGRLSIVLVDDSSEDGTAALARAAAPGDALSVIPARSLPAGWTGKMWAVAEGVRSAATSDYLLLTDADIAHPPDNLSGLVARARAGGYDLVSYMVRLRCVSAAEQALIPAFVFFFFLLYPPKWIADPARAEAGAAGGCILIRREALERIGGIERIRAEVIDDCALARAVKQSGGKVWLGLNCDAWSIREYGTFAEIGRMISRTAFTQLGYSGWMLLGTLAGLAVTYLAPPALTLTLPAGPARAMAAAAWLIMTAIYLPAVRYYRRPWFWAPLLPAITVFYLGATIWSAVTWWRGRGGMWKGRSAAPAR
ncbi:MAG: glycosyltransferase [Acidobacteria bacterium]|nr:glycosyltransferase [Acidobacteriota bacterium]